MNQLSNRTAVDAVTDGADATQFQNILNARLTRRQTLSGLAATTLAIAGCASPGGNDGADENPAPLTLGFSAVPKNLADRVTVPADYRVSLLYADGDPIDAASPAWSDAGTESGTSYQQRSGGHHDGMHFFGLNAAGALDRTASDRGLLCINHEAQNAFNAATGENSLYLHARGATVANFVRTVPDEVVKEINAHGVSVIEIRKDSAGKFALVRGSAFNRRITAATEMLISGPVAGTAAVKTRFSPDGLRTRGTVNNCANGYTPWGTYLTCEENWNGYFARAAGDAARRSARENASFARYDKKENSRGRFLWETAGSGDEFKRWDASVIQGKPADGSGDYRNVMNTYGWVVEIDPGNPASMPRKRTALGRFAHEGCWPAKAVAGKPVVFYMGDDNRGDYIYKFVSTQNFSERDTGLGAGDKYLDSGKLYAARFNADGSGVWLELGFGVNNITAAYPAYAFADQADVLLNARLAADAAVATKMDRPEWGAVNPKNGEVYFTLTNNTLAVRPVSAVDEANPRAYRDVNSGTNNKDGNPNGHIIRFRETGNEPAARTFEWDIFLFGAQADADPVNVNISGLTADNDLSSPDGLWFAREGSPSEGLLWIETDDGAYTDVTNCMLLAAIPGAVNDGSVKTIVSTLGDPAVSKTVVTKVGKPPAMDLRRILVGPRECEITGLDSTPDGKALFVNIQHPGEDRIPASFANADASSFGSNWPGNQFSGLGSRPRSATIVITRIDGGVVGIA